MTWKTHVAIGANAIWIAAALGRVNDSIIFLLPTAALASLLPDLDAGAAKIHFAGGGIFQTFRGFFTGKYLHHRGILHSLFAAGLYFLAFCLFFQDMLFPLVFAAAYFSHPLIDGLNTRVGYLYPFSLKRFALVPRALQTPIKGPVDNILFVIGAGCLLIFFLTFANNFVPI